MDPTTEKTWEVLGIKLAKIPDSQKHLLSPRYEGGMLIEDVRPHSPAAMNGMRRGDILVGLHIWETVNLSNVSYVLSNSKLYETPEFFATADSIFKDATALFSRLRRYKESNFQKLEVMNNTVNVGVFETGVLPFVVGEGETIKNCLYFFDTQAFCLKISSFQIGVYLGSSVRT